jgi:mRNA interferase RelE/StbE
VYRIVYGSRAEKDILSIGQRKIIRSVIRRIEALAVNPRPRGAEKLVGIEGWRIRIGKWRVLYQVSDRDRTVTVYRVKHRREAYR